RSPQRVPFLLPGFLQELPGLRQPPPVPVALPALPRWPLPVQPRLLLAQVPLPQPVSPQPLVLLRLLPPRRRVLLQPLPPLPPLLRLLLLPLPARPRPLPQHRPLLRPLLQPEPPLLQLLQHSQLQCSPRRPPQPAPLRLQVHRWRVRQLSSP